MKDLKVSNDANKLPDPDSRAYRALVLSGRLSALNDIGDYIAGLNCGLDDAGDGEYSVTVIENWHALMLWLGEAGREVKGDIEILKAEGSASDASSDPS